MFKPTTILLAAAIAGAASHDAFAYRTYGVWDTDEIAMRASSGTFPSGNAFRTSLGVVEDRFYNNPSNCWINVTYGDNSVSLDNGQNEIWGSSDEDFSPAVTFPEMRGDEIVEADVVFYAADEVTDDWEYTTSMSKGAITSYTADWENDLVERPFETTCLHEFGHVAGLDHEDDEYNIMGTDWTHVYCNGSTCRSGMGEDAADGLVDLYGRAGGGSFEDVAATLFKWTDRDGEYSVHGECGMYTSGGTALSPYDTYDYQSRFKVTKGTSYKVEFTYENNGETTQTRTAGFYISTNSTITTSDDRIATDTMELGRNSVYTKKTTITIPSDLTSGSTYYLGVIIDYSNALSEVDGSNNAAYHVIKIN